MRFSIFTILLLVTACYYVSGQDKDLESKFFKERNKIKKNRIEEITERRFSKWKAPCLKDSAEINFKYKFDRNGNLIQTNEYHHGQLWRTTNYERNKKGEYTAKTYFYYDSLGQVEDKYTSVWKFEFNKKGQKIRETLTSATNTLRVNELSYDKDGNYAGQLTDSTHKWTFEYDNKRNEIERREWSCRKDSVLCIKLTKYKYENDRLISEIIQSPKDFEVWNDFVYEYDTKGNLVYVTEKRTHWTRQNNGPRERHVLEYKTKQENDNRGFVRLKSVYSEKEENPIRCYFYDYVYRKN